MLRRILCLVLPAAGIFAQASDPNAAARARISEAALRADLRYLSDDRLEGRGVGSRADALTRLFVATRFERLGLQPGMPDGSFDQPVPIVGITAEVTTPLTATGNGQRIELTAPADYTAVAGAAVETSRWQDAELVFVGYGIDAPEQKWDDFKGADLRGKVLLVANNDPAGDPSLFAGDVRLYYGRWSYKYEEAARRGAIGAIVIHTTPSAGYPFQVIQATHGREAFWLPFAAREPSLQLRSWCSEDAARRLVALGGHDLDQLRASAESREFRPVPLGVRVTCATRNRIRTIDSGNVVAVLPGSDPVLRDEHVVVTAHFDHLGIGPEKKGDSIYNGALDNASGTAAMLAVAEACAALDPAPRRSLVFLCVTAEESGLLGSEWFARNPTVPAKRIAANYNIDGVNIWGRTSDVEMIGHGKNSLTALADEVARRHGRRLVPDHEPSLGLFYRSDHFSFARIGVPAAYFKAGTAFLDNPEGRNRVKAMYTTVHYHQPSDEFDPRWRLDGAVDDMRLLFDCLIATANADAAPTWTPGDEFERAR
jgi:Zn-dependent M28 family amino/carboxypeptidase